MKKITLFLKASLFVFSINSYGQIGINNDKPRGIIDFSENSGGLVLPKSKSPETYVRKPLSYRTSKTDTLVPAGTLIYDTQRKCMRVTSDNGRWSECIGNAINGTPVWNASPIKGVGIQNTDPKGLLDLNNKDGISDMGFLIPQVNDMKNLPANQLGSFVFDKSEKCLKFVFEDYDNNNKWSGCMNHTIARTDEDQEAYETSIRHSVGKRDLNLSGAVGIGTEAPHGVLDASQCSEPMVLPILDNALESKNILTDGTLVYDKSVRSPRVVYKDDTDNLHWSSPLPGANYCGYNAKNGGGKVYAIKEGFVRFPEKKGTFLLNASKDDVTIGFWAKGDANDSGALYAESFLSSFIAKGFLGFNKGKIFMDLKAYPKGGWNSLDSIDYKKFRLDGKWHYFLFEKTDKKNITVYVDNMKDSVGKFTLPNNKGHQRDAHSNMTVILGDRIKCCHEKWFPTTDIFKGQYTVVSFWNKNLNEKERILSKYGYPRNNYNTYTTYYGGIYIPNYGTNYTKDYSDKNHPRFLIAGYNAKILPADDLPVPFGRNVEVFNNVSTSKNINLENNQTGDNFTVIPTKGTAERVIIYESLDSPTNAEDHNLYKDFFGIDIEGASTDFTYNIKYKRKKLTCEDDLSLYMRNYHDGFSWTKLDKATIEKYNIYNIISSSESLSGNKEFIIGYDYN